MWKICYNYTIILYEPGFHVLARQGQGCWEMYKCYTIIQTSLDIDALLSRQIGIHPYQHVKMGFYDGWFHGVPNTLRPRRNWRHFADDILKWIFLNENVWIPIKISLKFVPQCPINNIPALVQIMAWRRPGASHYLDKWWLDYRRIYASLGLNELKTRSLCLMSDRQNRPI